MGDPNWKEHAQQRIEHRTIDQADLEAIIALADGEHVELVDFWVRGQPRPDTFSATFRVGLNGVGNMVERLVHSQLRPDIAVRLLPLNPSALVSASNPKPESWIRGQPSLRALDTTDTDS